VCIAVPGQVVSVNERNGIPVALVDVRGVQREAFLVFLPEVVVGDWVVVHLGSAIRRLDERSALETLATLDELGLVEGALGDHGPDPASGVPVDEWR
jgi:hydrogenase expression/formation protein HypC